MEASEVKRAINKLDQFATIPVILKKILEITGNPSSSPQDLYKVISHDQALAERVIRVANSSYFGHAGKVESINQSIMLLGYENIRDIAISMSVMGMLGRKDIINLKKFWAHSYEVACIAAMLAEMATILNPATLFLSGLLHDTGRLFFYNLDNENYRNLEGAKDLTGREIIMFGCDHARAGSWIAEKAQLPRELMLGIRYHHGPADAREFRDIVSVMALSEALSMRLSPKIEDDGQWTEDHDRIMLELSLNDEDIKEIGYRLSAEKADIKNFLKLV
ncbi:MAG: HDOD domain-containing protein [Nitrospirae bacterium]|nr:HDOD domain-containing protein [Nitrospirota bacterium]